MRNETEQRVAICHEDAHKGCGISVEDLWNFASITSRLDKLVTTLDLISKQQNSITETQFAFKTPPRRSDEGGLIRQIRPALPDPRLVRRFIRQRQLRSQFFDGDLFADPAWDMLLDLTAARAEHTRVSVTSLCIASGVALTTALRWIGQMIEAGLLVRHEDDTDRRRAFISLTDLAADGMARYFEQIVGLADMRI
jgi:DNA-binding MarR family transcriptional regulator